MDGLTYQITDKRTDQLVSTVLLRLQSEKQKKKNQKKIIINHFEELTFLKYMLDGQVKADSQAHI